MTTRVLLADDQALIRAGTRSLIESTHDLEVVGEATTGTEAVEKARTTRADVVLMDIRMPELDGIQATQAITTDDDLAGVKVLILTTFELDDYVFQALRAGASGFIGKSVEPNELLDAIRLIARGEALLSPQATRGLIAKFLDTPHAGKPTNALDVLTEREREILVHVASGLDNNEIAEHFHLSTLTVKTHVARAMTKLGARDRAQLVVIAFQTGLVRV
jgi:DNA-binding NarL/FixJ family response regulator